MNTKRSERRKRLEEKLEGKSLLLACTLLVVIGIIIWFLK